MPSLERVSMTSTPESAQARLATSRNALVLHMTGGIGKNGVNDQALSPSDETHARGERHSTWQVFTQAVLAWWKHHPAQVAIDVGRPFLTNYVRNKPLQVLCIAAGVGAAAVLVKPWRLISMTGLTVALLRSTTLSTTLLSLLPRASSSRPSKQTTQPSKDSA